MPLFGSSNPAVGTNHATLSNPTKTNFPNSFNIYHPKSLSSKIVLGTSEKQPIYCAEFPKGGLSDIIMYNGPSDQGGVLGICKPHGMGRTSTIYIPPMGTGNKPIQEEMRMEKQILKEVHSFAVVVGHGANASPEKFEWRSSGFRMGYKLVRLSSRNEETVAQWTYDSMGGLRSKVATFEFVGSGASGEMGDAWSLMAVLTMLRALQLHMQTGMAVAIGNS